MKDRIARLLFAYLARLGLVLCVADPGDPASGDPAAPTSAAPADTGAAGDASGNADPLLPAPDTRDPRDIELELLRKDKAKLERRFGRRTKAYHDAMAEIAQTRAQATGKPQGVPRANDDSDDDEDDAPRVDVEARADQLADEKLRRRDIADRTSRMLEAGKKIDTKFRDTVLDLANDLPFVDARTGQPTEFIEAVLDSKDPAALLHHIAQTPDVAESLQGLRGARLGARLAEIRIELGKAPPKPSNAPKPLEPLGGRGNSDKAEKAMTDEEWRSQRFKRA